MTIVWAVEEVYDDGAILYHIASTRTLAIEWIKARGKHKAENVWNVLPIEVDNQYVAINSTWYNKDGEEINAYIHS